MVSLGDLREARGRVAELAETNPLLQPVFDRLDREYELAKSGADDETPLKAAAKRRLEIRSLI